MLRLLPLLSAAVAIGAAALSLQSCKSQPPVAVAPAGSSGDIVVLADGATMAARKGSRDRAMADWLARANLSGTRFTLRDTTFMPGAARLTRQGLGEAATLATLLQATPDARVTLIGHDDPPGGRAGDKNIALKRGEALAVFLQRRGIASDRLQLGSNPRGSEVAAGQLTLVAVRDPGAQPLLTASH